MEKVPKSTPKKNGTVIKKMKGKKKVKNNYPVGMRYEILMKIVRFFLSLRLHLFIFVLLTCMLSGLLIWSVNLGIGLNDSYTSAHQNVEDINSQIVQYIDSLLLPPVRCAKNLKKLHEMGVLSYDPIPGSNDSTVDYRLFWKEVYQAPTIGCAQMGHKVGYYGSAGSWIGYCPTDAEDWWIQAFNTDSKIVAYNSLEDDQSVPDEANPIVAYPYNVEGRPFWTLTTKPFGHWGATYAAHSSEGTRMRLFTQYGMSIRNISNDDDYETVGFVGCSIRLDLISDYLEDMIELPHDAVVLLVNSTGELIASGKREIGIGEQQEMEDGQGVVTVRSMLEDIEFGGVGKTTRFVKNKLGLATSFMVDKEETVVKSPYTVILSPYSKNAVNWTIVTFLKTGSVFSSVINISWSSAVILIVQVFVSFIFILAVSLLMTKPLKDLQRNFSAIGDMKLDDVKFSNYFFNEFRDVSRALRKCVEWLKEYRSFLPTHVQSRNEINKNEGSSDDGSSGSSHSSNSSCSSNSSHSQGSVMFSVVPSQDPTFSTGINQRHVSLLTLAVLTLCKLSPKQLELMYSKLLSVVDLVKGIAIVRTGSCRVSLYYGGIGRALVNPAVRALNVALTLRKELNDVKDLFGQCKVLMSIVTGPCFVGNLRVGGMKSTTVIGQIVNYREIVNAFAVSTGLEVILCEKTHEWVVDGRMKVIMRKLYSHDNKGIYQIVSKRTSGSNWENELKEKVAVDTCKNYEDALKDLESLQGEKVVEIKDKLVDVKDKLLCVMDDVASELLMNIVDELFVQKDPDALVVLPPYSRLKEYFESLTREIPE